MKLAGYKEEILIIASYSYFLNKYFLNIYTRILRSILVTGDIELNKYVEISALKEFIFC